MTKLKLSWKILPRNPCSCHRVAETTIPTEPPSTLSVSINQNSLKNVRYSYFAPQVSGSPSPEFLSMERAMVSAEEFLIRHYKSKFREARRFLGKMGEVCDD